MDDGRGKCSSLHEYWHKTSIIDAEATVHRCMESTMAH